MKSTIQINNRWSGEVLFEHECDDNNICITIIEAVKSRANLSGANLSGADLFEANLSRAYLFGANLSGANLSRAYLSGANLSGADLFEANLSRAYLFGAYLSGANLSGANLSRAYLSGADGVNPWICDPLRILLAQTGTMRAYKLVTGKYESPIAPGQGYDAIAYHVGQSVEVEADPNEQEHCSYGISLGTLSWCLREWEDDYKILLVEFERDDLVAIPIATDGKFRVRRCTPIEEVDLGTIGWPPMPERKDCHED